MLNRVGNVVRGQLIAKVGETRDESAQSVSFLLGERKLTGEQRIEPGWQRRQAQVRDAMRETVVHVRGIDAL